MGESEILKIVTVLLSIIGTVALCIYHVSQSQRARADLIEKFEQALREGRKHAVCELFRMLHGLRMDYEDIQAICLSSNVTKIILALQKTPGLVKYENGTMQYTKRFEKAWVRLANKIATRVIVYFFGGLALIVGFYAIYLEGTASVAMFLFIVPLTGIWWMQLKDIYHDMMVERIVGRDNT